MLAYSLISKSGILAHLTQSVYKRMKLQGVKLQAKTPHARISLLRMMILSCPSITRIKNVVIAHQQ